MGEMTSKERFEAVIAGELPDRVPVHDVSSIVIAKSMGYEWKDVRYDAEKSAKLALEYSKKTGTDFLLGAIETPAMFMDLGVNVTQPDDNYGNVMEHYFKEPEDIDSKELYDPLNPKESPWLRKGIVDKILKIREINDTGILTSGWSWGVITTAGFLRGVETFLMETMTEPDIAHKVVKKAEALVDGIITVGDEGADYTWIADPTASGTVMDISTYREFGMPSTKKLADKWRSEFKVPLIYHVCGDTIPVMPAIVEMGIDILSIDHAVNIGEARELVKDGIVLMGNINPITVVWNGSESDIMKASEMCINAAGKEGRYILSPGCELPRDTSIENAAVMRKAAKTYGVYPF